MKSEDASHADYSQVSATTGAEASSYGSTARLSGEVMFARLTTLFPRSASGISMNDFLPGTASGLNRALAQPERPTSSLAQIALRAKTLALCRGDLTGTESGGIFSERDVLANGESLPTDANVRLAFTAVRNAWLYPYSADSVEVKEIASLYSNLKTSGGEAEARRGICVALMSAPQFLVGNPKKGDAVRKVYLDIARMRPPMQAILDFEASRKTLGQIVDTIQKGTDTKAGYLSAVRSWHREWLGLRDFLEGGDYFENRRYNGGASGNSYSLLAGVEIGNAADLNGKKVIAVSSDGGFHAQNCNLQTAGGQPNIQPFDPRTTMVNWEFLNHVANRWESFGAFVHKDKLDDYIGMIRAYAGGEADSVRAGCTLMSVTDPAHAVPGAPDYYLCGGRVAGSAGGFVATNLNDIAQIMGSLTVPNALSFVDARLRDGSVVGNFFRSERFDLKDMRLRRFSPSGEQTGLSAIKLWYTGEEVYVCNAFERFMVACSYRPPEYSRGPSGWLWEADTVWSPTDSWVKFGSWLRVDSVANPIKLNQMRCGHPLASEILRTDAYARDMVAFPPGYDASLGNYLNTAVPDQSGLNNIAMNADNRGAGVAEMAAIKRLNESLREEPYRLVNHIIQTDAPYSQLLTANYTVGTPELDLMYRGYGLHMPFYVPGAQPNTSSSSATQVIRFDTMPSLSGNLVSAPHSSTDGTKPAPMRVRPSAGILAMPAFLTPVASKMRTIASRYFTRLLCGEANVFQPNASQATLHEKYMVDAANIVASASAKAHLNHRQICYGCHVNLDPIGQALSPNYLRYVQENEGAAMFGEMDSTRTSNGYGIIGVNWTSNMGTGAVVGKEVTGVEQVAAAMAGSDLFTKCIVRRTFENVVGRQIALTDETEFARWVADFKKNGMNYNRLIRTIVDSPIYSAGD